MRKAFLVSVLALAVAGCASSGSAPQVSDLSVSRNQQPSETVTVQSGDTLYGIAWRNNMDFRELARLNGITPPYRIQPGQTLHLDGDAAAAGGQALAASGTAGDQASATSSGDSSQAADENPDWLAPDTQTIERNRRLTSESLDSAGEQGPSSEALAGAAAAGGVSGSSPGPIYNFESPGADGQLNERERQEQAAIARERAERAESESAGENQVAEADTQPSSSSATTDSQQRPVASNQAEEEAAPDAAQSGASASSGAGAGTAVAGGTDEPSSQQRRYAPVENIPWQWPAEGDVIGRFGDGSNITAGIDISGQKGQPIRAAGPGIVVYAGDGVRGYGNLILLKHNDRFLSAYAHNDSLRVQENDVVKTGEVIATMGNTDADGVKLHFEVRKEGQPQDPLEYLPSR